ncbi:nuclear transport factor 2 family protein [Endozoicomonas arenosclerae]|uniref:nuclear transport factor 2 family protein n=1 Tax=Endozoicomonas arenosclerae TaxID=1633495 RepID=UPI000783B342|nr:nuclear transport factor 2 family protein [Endozoicomonas arenosclerae]
MSDIQEVEELVEEYFRSLYEGDVEAIQKIYRPECVLQWTTEEGVKHIGMADYLEVVSNRQAPKDAGYGPYGQILSIDLSGSEVAVVKVASAVQPRYFEDYLTLVRDCDQWKIAAKVYRVVREE